MAKQLHVGQTHHLDGAGEWTSSNPDAVCVYPLNDKDGKQDSVDIMANAVTPEGEPAIITLNGAMVLRVNVVPAPAAPETVEQGQDLAPDQNA